LFTVFAVVEYCETLYQARGYCIFVAAGECVWPIILQVKST